MYCSKCGTQNDDNAFKCSKCGEIIQKIGTATTPSGQQVSSHLAPAILATIFCCLPFGIVAIVKAAKVNGKLRSGDYAGALRASNDAKTWCWIAFASVVVYVAVIGILAAIPQFSAYRTRSYNAAAEADLMNAAIAQEVYYVDNQTYTDTIKNLEGATYGFIPSQGVTVEIISAGKENYHMVAFHKEGKKKYQITGPGGVLAEYSESSKQ